MSKEKLLVNKRPSFLHSPFCYGVYLLIGVLLLPEFINLVIGSFISKTPESIFYYVFLLLCYLLVQIRLIQELLDPRSLLNELDDFLDTNKKNITTRHAKSLNALIISLLIIFAGIQMISFVQLIASDKFWLFLYFFILGWWLVGGLYNRLWDNLNLKKERAKSLAEHKIWQRIARKNIKRKSENEIIIPFADRRAVTIGSSRALVVAFGVVAIFEVASLISWGQYKNLLLMILLPIVLATFGWAGYVILSEERFKKFNTRRVVINKELGKIQLLHQNFKQSQLYTDEIQFGIPKSLVIFQIMLFESKSITTIWYSIFVQEATGHLVPLFFDTPEYKEAIQMGNVLARFLDTQLSQCVELKFNSDELRKFTEQKIWHVDELQHVIGNLIEEF